ncbi:MAG: peptidoglycan-binding protein [Actinomycetota bacterium]
MAGRLTAGLLAVVALAAACSGTDQSIEITDQVGGPAAGAGATSEETDAETATEATAATPDGSAAGETNPASAGETEPATDGGSSQAAASADAMIPAPAETAEQLAQPWIILRPSEPGASGPAVEAMQQRLSDLGFAPGTPDGDYGGRTERALSAFQDLVGLPPTGIADTSTMTALSQYEYDGLLVRAGDEGEAVEQLQERLASGPFDPGPIDGDYGTATKQAVWALEKLAGVPVDGDWGPLDELAWTRLEEGSIGRPAESHDQRWVEVDLSEQLAKVYDPGRTTPTLVVHISSGSGVPWANEEHSGSSITPKGEFHINRRISGWRESSLNIGRLYNPLYFNGGIAFHGATSVPLHPASHGCVRLPMHIAEYMPDELPNGTKVHVLA